MTPHHRYRRAVNLGAWALAGLLGTTPAAAQRATAGDSEHQPGSPLYFNLEVPADWNTQEITYDVAAIGRDTFLRRAFRSGSSTCPAATSCWYARLFLDYRLRPGEYTVTFTATGGDRPRTFTGRLRVGAHDDDGDGLPDVWENDHGLNRLSGAGGDGATGDPDGDGVSNLDEWRAGTMPRGRYRQYFGESSSGDRQQMYPCFVTSQPEQRFGAVRVRLIGDDGREQILPYGGCGLQNIEFVADRVIAVEVESFEPVVAERHLRSERDGHLSASRPADPSTEWHFAEGPSSGVVDVFLLAYNPRQTPVTATFTYYRSANEAPVITERTLGPGRTTVWINADEASLAGGDFAVAVHTSEPILVDRGLRWHPPGRTAPQESASPGTSRLSPRWFFPHADGLRQSDERIVLANPNDAGTHIEIATYTASRAPRVSYLNLGAHSRAVLRTADLGADAVIGLRLVSTNGVPIVAEHVQQGLGAPEGRWAFASAGADASGSAWALPSLHSEPSQLILFNPSTSEADIEVQGLWYQGTYDTPTVRTYRFRVPAERLLTVPIVNRSFFEEPAGSISSIISSAVILSRPAGDSGAAAIVVGRAAPAGALGVREARTEHFVATRLH